jgi:hypothetical protein
MRFHTSILSHGDLSCKRFGNAANFTLGLVCGFRARSIIDGLRRVWGLLEAMSEPYITGCGPPMVSMPTAN